MHSVQPALGDAAAHRRAVEPARRVDLGMPSARFMVFWNAGDSPCRIFEIISSGASSAEVAAGTDPGDDVPARYGLVLDLDSIPGLCAEHALTFPGVASAVTADRDVPAGECWVKCDAGHCAAPGR